MKLKKLLLKNIRSYKHEEISFPEGSVLLAGDIGAGKTSLLLAIEYALFGLQPGQKGSALMRNDANIGKVILEFEIDSNNIMIERRLKRKNKAVTNEYSAISINGQRIESSLTETKTKILEILGYPNEFIKKNNLLYRYTVYTPQEQMKEIILEDAEIRLNVIRHIFGIDKYRLISGNLVILLNKFKEECKLLQGEIKTLDEEKYKFQLKKDFLKELDKKLEEKTKDLHFKIKARENIESESSKLEGKIKEKEQFEKEIEKTKIMLETKNENLLAINLEILELEKAFSESREKFKEKEYSNIIKKIQAKNEHIDHLNSQYANTISEINFLEKNKAETIVERDRIFKIDICPTCLQDVPEMHKHNIINKTDSYIAALSRKKILLEEEAHHILNSINKEKSEKELLEGEKIKFDILKARFEYLESTKIKLENFERIKINLEKDISILNKKIEALVSQITEFSKFNALFKLNKEELRNALELEKETEISIAELKKELQLMRLELLSLEASIKAKENSKKKLLSIIEISDWLSTNFISLVEFTERNVLIKLRREFSKIFSKWFRMLVPEESLNVRLDESFSPVLMHNDTEMEYSFLSGGDRTAIALAYRLALNQTINSMLSKIKTKDIVILDEPTDGFSDIQLERMRSIFEELNVSQLIVVSHEQKIEGLVSNILRIKKSGDASYLDSNLPVMPSSQNESLIKLSEP